MIPHSMDVPNNPVRDDFPGFDEQNVIWPDRADRRIRQSKIQGRWCNLYRAIAPGARNADRAHATHRTSLRR
jgi:hypothetical protein